MLCFFVVVVVVFLFKNFFMLSVRISSYGCTLEVRRARKMRKTAESNCSFLSALKRLPKCIHNSI